MDNVASVQALDQAVEMYVDLTAGQWSTDAQVSATGRTLTAALRVKQELDVSLADLHDALVARGLLKSYGA